jgi:hypothetical protein
MPPYQFAPSPGPLRMLLRRQSMTHFPMANEMHTCGAARHFRSFQAQFSQLSRPTKTFTVRHNLGNHSRMLYPPPVAAD